jgi:hypothetical protein
MKSIVILVMSLFSTAVLAGTKEETKAPQARPGHQVTIDLDKLAQVTKDISLLQPVIKLVKWVSRPEPAQQIRKQKSYFI